MKKALIIIDLQNDYFGGGKYPLWNTEEVLRNTKQAIQRAKKNNIPVILIQHVADTKAGIAPFFNEGTLGVKIHEEILRLAPGAKIVKKGYADSFFRTNLEETLSTLDIDELLICGMMTQNCVTHTALSETAKKYTISILSDCCTTVDKTIHLIALKAIAPKISVVQFEEIL